MDVSSSVLEPSGESGVVDGDGLPGGSNGGIKGCHGGGIFPANADMLMDADQFPAIPVWALLARLPLQGVLIAWVWWAAVKRPRIAQAAEDAS